MAAYFLSNASGVGGTGDGSSWANAYLTLDAVLARVTPAFLAGDTIWVGDDHNETFAQVAAKVWTFPGTTAAPNYLYCVDHTVGSPTAANLKTTAFIGAGHATSNFSTTFTGGFYAYGITFAAGVGGNGLLNLSIGAASTAFTVVLDNCVLYHASSRAGGGGSIICGNNIHNNCSYRNKVLGNTLSFSFTFSYSCVLDAQDTGGVYSGTTPWISYSSSQQVWNAEDCDFSALTAPLLPNNPNFGNLLITLKRCKLGAAATIQQAQTTTNKVSTNANLIQCDSGTVYSRNERYMGLGNLTTSSAVVRTGGAQDYAIGISHRVLTGAYTRWIAAFEALPIAIWNATVGTVNVTVEFIAGTRDFAAIPNNDEVWIDVEYFSSSSSVRGATARGTKASNLNTGSAQTASTEAWDSMATARANSTLYNTLGSIRKVASNPGRLFVLTTAGTSASSEPGGYASAVDGGSVTDGTATFKAMWRFKQTVTITTGREGYIYVHPRVGKASMVDGVYIDPFIVLS